MCGEWEYTYSGEKEENKPKRRREGRGETSKKTFFLIVRGGFMLRRYSPGSIRETSANLVPDGDS